MNKWQPSNEPGRYDKARLAQIAPVQAAIQALGLPPLRQRKLNGVLNALIMQIEDGGDSPAVDSPAVNELLLEALQTAVLHQVGAARGTAVLQAIERFAQAEAERWQQVKAGTLPPVQLSPLEQLEELMQTGYSLVNQNQYVAACDQWLAAWQLVQQLAPADASSSEAVDAAYPHLFPPISQWAPDLMFELHNAGLKDPAYFEKRLAYVHDFLDRFPDEDEDSVLEYRRAQGEALWRLGRVAEAEAVFKALVADMPDKAWAYIGWSDEYYLFKDSPKDYERAADILHQGWDRVKLDDRPSLQERLERLYEEWERPLPRLKLPTARLQFSKRGGKRRKRKRS
jgi:tetratricopeptide (TPR) repeat protein